MLKKLLYLHLILVLVLANFQPASAADVFRQDYIPQDPDLVYQSYFDFINIKPSWSRSLLVNKEVIVAILDSGVDLDHPDLVDNIWHNPGEVPNNNFDDDGNSYIDDVTGWDFVDSDQTPEPDIDGEYDLVAVNHGTVVAGILAASANNQGIIGIAPQVKIMPLRILNELGQGNTLVLAQAIDYAVENGADIINLSLVGQSYDTLIKDSVQRAYNHGVVIIAASGNEESSGLNLNLYPRYPVCEQDSTNRIFGVAALNAQKKLASFSNYGSNCIDISAPGANFYSTLFQRDGHPQFSAYYGQGWSGTSVAAPIIAGTAGLLKMMYPDFQVQKIYQILNNSAQSLKEADPVNYTNLGSGLIDIGAALNLAAIMHDQSRFIVLAPAAGLEPRIALLDQRGQEISSFLAYAEKFKGGVNVAVGDVNYDGEQEIVTAAGKTGGPHIRVFSKDGQLLSEFFAYQSNFYGGVNVAVGDVDGDGRQEIITAPQSNGGPHIKIFAADGKMKEEFFAFEGNFYGGVNVAVGDVNNDGLDEIITVPASNRQAEVRVFHWQNMIKSSFIAYDNFTAGVTLAVGDVNADGWPEIITAPALSVPARIKTFSYRGRLKNEFLAYTDAFKNGIDLLAKDLTGDGWPEILTLPNAGSAALLKIYNYDGLEKDSYYLRPVTDKNGYQLEIIN